MSEGTISDTAAQLTDNIMDLLKFLDTYGDADTVKDNHL